MTKEKLDLANTVNYRVERIRNQLAKLSTDKPDIIDWYYTLSDRAIDAIVKIAKEDLKYSLIKSEQAFKELK